MPSLQPPDGRDAHRLDQAAILFLYRHILGDPLPWITDIVRAQRPERIPVAGLKMYGTCSSRAAAAVPELGAVPIDYQTQDFVKEIHRLTRDGVDVVFDGLGGTHIWRSRKALCPGGTVVAYGLTASLRSGRLASGRSGGRHRFREIGIFGLYIAAGWLLPGRRRVIPYSIQTLMRLKPALFRNDLIALLDLLQQKRIKPHIAQRFPLREAKHA